MEVRVIRVVTRFVEDDDGLRMPDMPRGRWRVVPDTLSAQQTVVVEAQNADLDAILDHLGEAAILDVDDEAL
jgi:hypothetical protein